MKISTPLLAVLFLAAFSTGTPISSTQIDIFAALDDFSLVMVFDWLNFRDLSNIATLNPRYYELIATHNIPRCKLNEGKIKIWLSTNDSTSITHELVAGYTNLAEDYKETAFALKSFGHLFEHIEFGVASDSHAAVQELFLSNDNGEAKITLPGAKRVVIDWDIKDISDFHIARIFPNVEHLMFERSIFPFPGHCQHLKHFTVKRAIEKMDDLPRFLRLNPQLESFKAPMEWDNIYLHELNEFLPNLENLSMKLSYSRKKPVKSFEEINFKNVKNFELILDYDDHRIDRATRDLLTSIVFDHLESFTMNADIDRPTRFFMDLIVRNRDLANVQFHKFAMTEQTWSALVAGLPRLPQVSIENIDRAEIWDLMRFLRVRRSLERVLVKTDASGVDLFRHVEGELWLGDRPYRMIIVESTNRKQLVTFERVEEDQMNLD